MKTRSMLVLSSALVILLLLAAACGGGGPEELEIPVKLTADKLEPETIRVKQGDSVTLVIQSDEAGELHLHGYDIEMPVHSGEAATYSFVADATGRFPIAFHPSGNGMMDDGEDDGHGEVFQSPVLQTGGSFTFQVPDNMSGQSIEYQSHLHPEVVGKIMVTREAPTSGTVQVEIKNMAVHPAEIIVAPGTTIVWTNNDDVPQSLSSGRHSEVVEHEDVAGHEAEHEDAEEINAGYLEVLPR